MKHNGRNERLKRAYAQYLKDARRLGEAAIDAALAAIERFEVYTNRRDFAGFHIEYASGFKDDLAKQLNGRTRKPLSVQTQLHTLAALRSFFTWLADQRGFRRRIRHSDADYFSLSLKQTAIARAAREIEGPTIEQVRHVIEQMPAQTDIERRNRALIALAVLTGARDDALASLRLKHVDVAQRRVLQDAREVRTKASKTMETWFFPVGDDFVRILEDWVEFLRVQRHWGLDDPVFPKTRVTVGQGNRFEPVGLARGCWSSATPIRVIFRNAFTAAGLPYFNPHSIRKTLARFGQERCKSPEQFKAWSQNLGHEKVLTTFTSYGQVDRLRQRDIILELSRPPNEGNPNLEGLLREALEITQARAAEYRELNRSDRSDARIRPN
jgi:integrase